MNYPPNAPMFQDLCLPFHGYQVPTINYSKAWQDLQ